MLCWSYVLQLAASVPGNTNIAVRATWHVRIVWQLRQHGMASATVLHMQRMQYALHT